MTALRRTAQRKTADLSAVPLIAIAFGFALAVVSFSVRAETKVGGATAPQSTPAATVDNANRSAPVPSSGGPIPQLGLAQGPVPVPSSGGPIPPIRPAQGPAPVPAPPASGTTGPTPLPQIAAPAAVMRLRSRGRRCSRGARRALGGAAIEAAAQPAKRELRSSCFAFPPVRAGRF